jgi:copper chaperone
MKNQLTQKIKSEAIMEKTQFKTTIKCAGCIAQATPFLNEALGEKTWEVDVNNPSKTLTVSNQTDSQNVIAAVEKAGFKAEKL